MKKIMLIISLLAGIVLYTACTPENPAVFEQADAIYFNAASDTISYSFAKYPHRPQDTVWIPVKVLGNASQTDQPITIEKATGAEVTAIEGVHYKLLEPYTVPADSFSTLLPVVIYRTIDLDKAAVSLKLQLKANEHFALGITAKTAVKINIGYLQKPATWGDYSGLSGFWAGYSTNFGTWTPTKYKLILDALYDPVNDVTISEFPYNRIGGPTILLQYLQLVRNYIRTNYPGNVSGTGATLLDPDAGNLPVQVGPANY